MNNLLNGEYNGFILISIFSLIILSYNIYKYLTTEEIEKTENFEKTEEEIENEEFDDSFALGIITNNPILSGAIGGSFIGGYAGSLFNSDQDNY